MTLDSCKKIAVELTAAEKTGAPLVLVLTSSSPKVDCLPAAKRLQEAFASLRLSSCLLDGREEATASLAAKAKELLPDGGWNADGEQPVLSTGEAASLVSALKAAYGVTLLVTKPLAESECAMLLASAAGNVLLLEEKKLSRTDEIDTTLEIIKNLQARPLGFVLQ